MTPEEERRKVLFDETKPRTRRKLAAVPDPALARPALTRAGRALALASAKAVAFSWVTAVRASDAPALQRISDGLSREALSALAIVLAETADINRLKTVKEADDEGRTTR